MLRYSVWQWLRLLAGPLAFVFVILWVDLDPLKAQTTYMAAIIAWVGLWWFLEPVDLAVTSLLPFVLIPLLGISTPAYTAAQYMDPIIFLFIGGFIMAFAMERWQVHTRLALGILRYTGSSPSRILAGVMAATFFLSMWVSNTATVLLLIPAVMAVIGHIRGDHDTGGRHPLAIALLLGLAYAATMGGMSTLVGTPPNMYFYSFYQRTFPGDSSVHFASFLVIALPTTIMMAMLTYQIIRWRYLRDSHATLTTGYFKQSFQALGRMTRDQKVVVGVFVLTVLAWFTRPDMGFGAVVIPGWATLTGLGTKVHDGMVVIMACLVLFLWPARAAERRLLEWTDLQRLPFGIILLFGSGFALAKGFEDSGLADLVGEHLQFVQDFHPFILLLILGLVITMISEFASNIACVQLILPIIATLETREDLSMMAMMMATTLFASMGFMMPVATAPNTIIFGSGEVRTHDLVKTGFWINMGGVLIITLVIYLVFG